jgi:hypothetical protein
MIVGNPIYPLKNDLAQDIVYGQMNFQSGHEGLPEVDLHKLFSTQSKVMSELNQLNSRINKSQLLN